MPQAMPSVQSMLLSCALALSFLANFSSAGEKKAPAPEKPPATPEEILKGVKVEKGFDVNVFASPPNISYPVCISAAPTGELFVGVDENGSLGAKPNRGRVVKCTDTNGDGVAD